MKSLGIACIGFLALFLTMTMSASAVPDARSFEAQETEVSPHVCYTGVVPIESAEDWFAALVMNVGYLSDRAEQGAGNIFVVTDPETGEPRSYLFNDPTTPNVGDFRIMTHDDGPALSFAMGSAVFLQMIAQGRDVTVAWHDPSNGMGYAYNSIRGSVTRSETCTCGCGSPHEETCDGMCHIRQGRSAPEVVAGNGVHQ